MARCTRGCPRREAPSRDQQVAVEVCGSVAGRWAEHRQRDRDERGDRRRRRDLALGEGRRAESESRADRDLDYGTRETGYASTRRVPRPRLPCSSRRRWRCLPARPAPRRRRFAFVVPGLELADLEALQQRAAVGLLVPGAGPRVSEAAALAGLERGDGPELPSGRASRPAGADLGRTSRTRCRGQGPTSSSACPRAATSRTTGATRSP